MEPQLTHHRLVVPQARADEELDGLAGHPRRDRDRLTGLALQAAQQPADDERGVLALFGAIELGQVTFQEARQVVRAVPNGVGENGGVVQERLSLGVIQE